MPLIPEDIEQTFWQLVHQCREETRGISSTTQAVRSPDIVGCVNNASNQPRGKAIFLLLIQ